MTNSPTSNTHNIELSMVVACVMSRLGTYLDMMINHLEHSPGDLAVISDIGASLVRDQKRELDEVVSCLERSFGEIQVTYKGSSVIDTTAAR